MVVSVARVERIVSVAESEVESVAERVARSALSALSAPESTAEVIVVVRFAHKGRNSSSISNMIY